MTPSSISIGLTSYPILSGKLASALVRMRTRATLSGIFLVGYVPNVNTRFLVSSGTISKRSSDTMGRRQKDASEIFC